MESRQRQEVATVMQFSTYNFSLAQKAKKTSTVGVTAKRAGRLRNDVLRKKVGSDDGECSFSKGSQIGMDHNPGE